VRAVFTFFHGVDQGLDRRRRAVLVLSIMNGFESDLRQKILGPNAHIQIAKEGEFPSGSGGRSTGAGRGGVDAVRDHEA
jgi:ABC-type lipoprotein release transport system permease subunit